MSQNVCKNGISKYFDTLNHDRLVRELRKNVKDETMMKLIKKFLKAGVMEDGVVIETTEGSPHKAEILSPLLSGIYLNEFDHEYARRGVPEIRYADDIVLLAKSKRAAERLLEGSIKYLEGKLKLKVNRDKSRIVNLAFNYGEFKFLGFGMGKRNGTFHIYAHKKSKDKFKAKLKEITSRKRPGKMPVIFEELKRVIRGWMNYFGIAEMGTWAKETDAWLRARVRMMLWKRWKKPKTKYKRLMQYGTPEKYAYMAANSRRGYWFAVHTGAVTRSLSNKMLAGTGYISVSDTYKRVHEKPVQLQFAF